MFLEDCNSKNRKLTHMKNYENFILLKQRSIKKVFKGNIKKEMGEFYRYDHTILTFFIRVETSRII